MSLKETEKYLKPKYDLRYNVINNRTYFKYKTCTSCSFILLIDYVLNSIHRELRKKNINISKSALRDLLQSDFVKKYNPITSYFKSLEKWDSKTDYINQLVKTVETNNNILFQWAFKKWFVAMIACAVDDKVVNHCVLIFIGEQGIGKSRWSESLLPEELKSLMSSGRINPNDKDSMFLLTECMLIIMEEIGTFSKHQTEAFKELITKDVIRERRAYAVYAENYVRRASFIGSSNNPQILVDITGNRRFLVFKAVKILSTGNIDLDKVYAQGFYLYKNGFQYWFDQKDIKKINAHNNQFRLVSSEEELLLKYYEPAQRDDEPALFLSATEVVRHIIKRENITIANKLTNVEMGKVLSARGFVEIKKKGLKKYILKLKLC